MGRPGNTIALLKIIAFTALLPAAQADAARQGTLGSTSSGSVSISVSVPAQARVSGLEDIQFVGADSSLLRASREICLSGNSLARSFTVAAIGSGPEGMLELSNGSQAVAYSVRWSLAEHSNSDLHPSAASPTADIDASSAELECRSGQGLARLTVAVDNPLLGKGGPEPPYTGTLTLFFSPQ